VGWDVRKLATALALLGVARERRVVVFVEGGYPLVVAELAVLQAGTVTWKQNIV